MFSSQALVCSGYMGERGCDDLLRGPSVPATASAVSSVYQNYYTNWQRNESRDWGLLYISSQELIRCTSNPIILAFHYALLILRRCYLTDICVVHIFIIEITVHFFVLVPFYLKNVK